MSWYLHWRSLAFATMLLSSSASWQTGRDLPGPKAIYFLSDETRNQWCGYTEDARFRSQIQPLGATVFGKLDYLDGRPAQVGVTQVDESGDWAVNDEYLLNANGTVRGLKRTINIIPEDLSQEIVFDVRDGKAIRRSVSSRELRSGKATEKSAPWFDPPPIITNATDFQFWALTRARQSIWSSGEACVPRNAK